MKNFIICLGLGKNQVKFLNKIDRSYGIIGIDIKYPEKIKNKIDLYYKGSLYNLNHIKKISKNIKKKKYLVKFVLYRSSGPTILAAQYLEKFFKINRIDNTLSKSIYSKSYFYRYLKSKRVPGLKSNSVKKLSNDKNIVIKPDAPIYGKKNIYFLNKKKISLFNKCKTESHNNRVNISNFYEGDDISSFYYKEKKNKKINLISHVQEFNFFKKNRIQSYGICSPPIELKKQILKKKFAIDRTIIESFKDFYGIVSISSKIINKKKIYPYEINIGLSGDHYAELIFPFNFNNGSLYKIELDICLNNKKIKLSNNKKFIGLFCGKKITSNTFFKEKINCIK